MERENSVNNLTAIHISEIYNRDSIIKSGLIPSTIGLDHHLERFREDGYLEENENKMLYMWLDSEKNERFIKDMMYCKMWITPRNKLFNKHLENHEEENYCDFSKVKMQSLYPYTGMIYDIYKITSPLTVTDDLNIYHEQESSDVNTSTVYHMDDRYAHNDKILILSKKVEKNIIRIGQAKVWVDKKDKIQTKIFKSVIK